MITDSLPGQPRWPVLVYMALCCIVGAICILVWSSPVGLKFFGFCEYQTRIRWANCLSEVQLDLAAGSYAGQATTFS